METIAVDQSGFNEKGSFNSGIEALEDAITIVQNTRATVCEESSSLLTADFSTVQDQIRCSMDLLNGNLKDVHKASQSFGRSLDKRFKPKTPLTTEEAELHSDTLLDRAIGMHLLREGLFDVASAFLEETASAPAPEAQQDILLDPTPDSLRQDFLEMYNILHQMRQHHNLERAMKWASTRSSALQSRGSNLEFELARLQYLWLFNGATRDNMPVAEKQIEALMYARKAFSGFSSRYVKDIQQLIGALAFSSDLETSPYSLMFEIANSWEDLALLFTREYCSLLGLSADSPLFIATTAGALALPMLEKLYNIMKEKRTEWTTEHELPVEIPLPTSYRFHSIFVCPVSKEQTTDSNPPMLLPCGHIVAQESLSRISKLAKFKCPYCPEESHYNDARKIVL